MKMRLRQDAYQWTLEGQRGERPVSLRNDGQTRTKRWRVMGHHTRLDGALAQALEALVKQELGDSSLAEQVAGLRAALASALAEVKALASEASRSVQAARGGGTAREPDFPYAQPEGPCAAPTQDA